MRPARGRIDTFARRRRSENAVARCANIEAPANKGPLLVLLRGMSQPSTESLQFVLLEDDPNDAELIELELARNGLNIEWRHVVSEKAFREAPGLRWTDGAQDHAEVLPRRALHLRVGLAW